MSQADLRRQFKALLEEDEQRELSRYIHLAVVLEDPNGREIYWAGGEWDRVDKRYTGAYRKAHRIRLKASQMESAELALWWLQEKKAGRPPPFTVLFLMGDRGSGKTALAV